MVKALLRLMSKPPPPDDPPRRGAPVGNANAAKDDGFDAQINIRCQTGEKNAWVKAAKPGKLALWIRATLNQAAGVPAPEPPGKD